MGNDWRYDDLYHIEQGGSNDNSSELNVGCTRQTTKIQTFFIGITPVPLSHLFLSKIKTTIR